MIAYGALFVREDTFSRIKYMKNCYVSSGDGYPWTIQQFLPDETYLDNKYVCPLKETDFTNHPPTVFIIATIDCVYTENLEYYNLLTRNKVETYKMEIKNGHGFFRYYNKIQDSNKCYKELFEIFKKKNILK